VHGADVIELDVRRAGDGTLVVHHDGEIGDRPVRTLTRADIDPDIPSFAECAAALRGRIRLDVELKERGIAGDVLAILGETKWPLDDFAITSFDRSALLEARQQQPVVLLGLLTEDADLTAALAAVSSGAADFLGPDQAVLDDRALTQCRRSGVPIVPWVVNDRLRLRTLLAHDAIFGVITDALPSALDVRRDMLGEPRSRG
jgi:glycerophosphoryl diester phosphodiesterase